MHTYFLVKFFITCNSQRKYRSGASCMAYGFVSVFDGSLKERRKYMTQVSDSTVEKAKSIISYSAKRAFLDPRPLSS